MQLSEHMKSILMSCLWAPSGDNAQPWTITPLSQDSIRLDIKKSQRNSYNLVPIPDWVSLGMFIENGRLMAQKLGYDLAYEIVDLETVIVHLDAAETQNSDLLAYVEQRSVNRYIYKTNALDDEFKGALTAQLDDDIEIHWYESFKEKLTVARLMMRATDLRLRMDETYPIHRDLIEWSDADSMDKIPMGSLGLSAPSLSMMKWVLSDEARSRAMMKLPAATLMTQIELDLLPGLMCSGHYVMAFDPQKVPKPEMADYIRAGQSMQRFWLRLTQQGYAMQPWYIVFMFSLYCQRNIPFTQRQKQATGIHEHFMGKVLAPKNISLEHIFFTGRVGIARRANITRSIRKPLASFMAQSD
jgi:hypothetical protein|tara:strand:+ start:173372 stop:174442 length:1071 start_codon:yes stop_codon:yes gene_type:complete